MVVDNHSVTEGTENRAWGAPHSHPICSQVSTSQKQDPKGLPQMDDLSAESPFSPKPARCLAHLAAPRHHHIYLVLFNVAARSPTRPPTSIPPCQLPAPACLLPAPPVHSHCQGIHRVDEASPHPPRTMHQPLRARNYHKASLSCVPLPLVTPAATPDQRRTWLTLVEWRRRASRRTTSGRCRPIVASQKAGT